MYLEILTEESMVLVYVRFILHLLSLSIIWLLFLGQFIISLLLFGPGMSYIGRIKVSMPQNVKVSLLLRYFYTQKY